MNWLAHIFLSTPTIENRLGNLLGDLVKGADRDRLEPSVMAGVKRHYAIDRFTDTHPIVKTSKQRIDREYHKFAGILIDVFYDHFLAKNWHLYSEISLSDFTADIYTSFQSYPQQLPQFATATIARMVDGDWLTGYRTRSGIEHTLHRIDDRIQNRMDIRIELAEAMTSFDREYVALDRDFKLFFPELQQYIDNWPTSDCSQSPA